MYASQIQVNGTIKIELPDTDALQIISSQTSMDNWIKKNGNLTVELSDDGVYTIPSFKEGREKFKEAKTIFCRQWGCE